jgi:membrane associated rhomboid family serine protease
MTTITLTIIIIAITCIVSFLCFSNEKLLNDLIFYPPAMTNQNQWYRFVTCGFIHADIMHLAFNMYSFYMFGEAIEGAFNDYFGPQGKALFLLLYISSLIVCLLPTYFKHKNDYHYRSLGASGAVSAIVFTFIFLAPTAKIGLILIPIKAPAFIFGIIYIIVSAVLAKRGRSNINHSAHLWGGIYGIAFLIVSCYFLSDYRPVQNFIDQTSQWIKSF